MFIIRNIPEQKYFADIKHVTVTADSPDPSIFNAEIIHTTNGYYYGRGEYSCIYQWL